MNFGSLYVILSGILFGLVPLLTVQLLNGGLNTVSITFYRYLFFIPIVFVIKIIKGIHLKVDQPTLIKIILNCGVVSLATSLLLSSSYNYIASGTATTLHFLYPIIVILISIVYYRQKPDKNLIVSVILVIIGIFCFLFGTSLNNLFGVTLASLSAITYAIYILRLEKSKVNRLNPIVVSFYQAIFLSLGAISLSPAMGGITIGLSTKQLLLLLGISLMSISATSLFQLGSRTVGSQLTALLSLTEPITSVVSGVLLLAEPVSITKIIGSVVILVAIVQLIAKKNTKLHH